MFGSAVFCVVPLPCILPFDWGSKLRIIRMYCTYVRLDTYMYYHWYTEKRNSAFPVGSNFADDVTKVSLLRAFP